MALGEKSEKQVLHYSVLPSMRAIRFMRLDTKTLMELTERAVGGLDSSATQPMMGLALQKETVATCLRGVSKRKLEMAFSEKIAPDGKLAKLADLDATLAPVIDSDESWQELSYQELVGDGAMSMFKLFSDPGDWRALLDRVGTTEAPAIDPFSGKVSRRTG